MVKAFFKINPYSGECQQVGVLQGYDYIHIALLRGFTLGGGSEQAERQNSIPLLVFIPKLRQSLNGFVFIDAMFLGLAFLVVNASRWNSIHS
jgi:hypothetical protein